jgi:DNA-binding NarL/FixJ family response regulator
MSTRSKIRIVIADDHFVVRLGLVAMLSTEADMEVVGEAENGNEAAEIFEKLKPDLVLMDVRMPGKDGIQATAEIKEKFLSARILMLSNSDGHEDIHRALRAGAQGYVLKSSIREFLLPALRTVAAGGHWIPKDVARMGISCGSNPRNQAPCSASRRAGTTFQLRKSVRCASALILGHSFMNQQSAGVSNTPNDQHATV